MMLSGWCLPVPLIMACFDASLSHSWIEGFVKVG